MRLVFRWIHIAVAIPIVGYIYTPFNQIPNYAPAVRFVFLPVMFASGLWMWKGHAVRRLVSNWPVGSDKRGGSGAKERRGDLSYKSRESRI